jgi:hypothetical protein
MALRMTTHASVEINLWQHAVTRVSKARQLDESTSGETLLALAYAKYPEQDN